MCQTLLNRFHSLISQLVWVRKLKLRETSRLAHHSRWEDPEMKVNSGSLCIETDLWTKGEKAEGTKSGVWTADTNYHI